MLTKDAIFSAEDIRTRDVEVPEWGGSVRVRTMTGSDRQSFYAAMSHNEKHNLPDNMMERLIIATVIDEQGNPLFVPSDIPKLAKKSAVALNRVFEVASELNGLTSKSIDKMTGE